MAGLLSIVALIAGIGSLVCWIFVLVQIFKAGEIWQGIVGIICPLFAFIWGWMHADRLGVRKVMGIWTVLILVGIVINILIATAFRPEVVTTPRLNTTP